MQSLLKRREQTLSVTANKSDFKELSEKFHDLLNSVVMCFESLPNGLKKLKETVVSLVLPLCEGGVVPVVPPSLYSKATTVREFFSSLSPLLNPISFHLLCSLSHLCDCKSALEATSTYSQYISSNNHLVICIDKWTTPANSDGLNDLNAVASPNAQTVSLDELKSFQPLLFTNPLAEHSGITLLKDRGIRISARVRKKFISLVDYDAILTAICGYLLLPKCSLTFIGCTEKPLTLCWQMNTELLAYVCGVRIDVSSEFMLSDGGVLHLMVGDWMNYKCLTLEVIHYIVCVSVRQ